MSTEKHKVFGMETSRRYYCDYYKRFLHCSRSRSLRTARRRNDNKDKRFIHYKLSKGEMTIKIGFLYTKNTELQFRASKIVDCYIKKFGHSN